MAGGGDEAGGERLSRRGGEIEGGGNLAAGGRPPGLWGGGFAAGPAAGLDRLNRSLPVDWRLWPHELRVDRAWVSELVDSGHLEADEGRRLAAGLDAVEARLEAGSPADEPDEDIHSLVERWLAEEVGPAASQVRLGRSRNDVVATDARLWTLEALERSAAALRALQEALLEAAGRWGELPFPAYTHLQPAQPTRAGIWLLAHFWALERDRERVRQTAARTRRLPLGAAAGAGTTLQVDRGRLAERLGLDPPLENALDAVQARDWAAEALWCWAMAAVDLSRLAEDLVVYASREFGLLRMHDAWSTGSSLMPQKRNPDGAELARAHGGTAVGRLAGLLGALKGLPSGYAKDLQVDKRALFEAEEEADRVLGALAGTVRTLEPVPEAARRALVPGLLASDAAEALTAGSDISFREAHEAVSRLVRRAEEAGVEPSVAPPELLDAVDPRLRRIPADVWDPERALERRDAEGGSSRRALAAQIEAARATLEGPPAV